MHKSDIFFTHFKRVKMFSKSSFDWLSEPQFLTANPYFRNYYHFGTKEAASVELTFETFLSLRSNFANSPKAHFRVAIPQLEVFFTHKKEALEELLSLSGSDQKATEGHLKTANFSSFCVIKTRSNSHQLLEKLEDLKMKFYEFERKSKFEELTTEKFIVASGKKVAFVLQSLLDFFCSTGRFYEVIANFPFDNCSIKRVPIEHKKFMKGAVTVIEKWELCEKVSRGKTKDIGKYKLAVETKGKKDQIARIIDPNSEMTSGVFLGSEIFGSALIKLLRFVQANNPDFKLILE